MKEIQITAYVAEDGRQFTDKEQCIAWEKETKDAKRVIQKYNDIIDYCRNHVDENDESGNNGCSNEECPFYTTHERCNCVFGCLPYIDMDKIEG